MHIMVVPSWYSSYKNPVHGSFFKEQFRALKNAGYKVTVAYNEIWPITKLFSIKEKKGIAYDFEGELDTYRYKEFNYFPKNPLMFKVFNRRMEKLYLKIVKEKGKVDLIHAHSAFFGGISAYYVAKKYNIPFVLTEHSSLKYAKYVRKSYIKYIKECYDNADSLIAVGNSLKREMEDYTDNPIQVVNNIVDFSIFNKELSEIEDKSSNINSKKKTTILFSLSFLVEEKGMDRLIEAFNASLKGKNVILKIGGDGPMRKELEQMVREYKLESQIIFVGALSRQKVAMEMNNCDGFVLASEHETFGVVYIEALSMGKPILGTQNGGANDIINSKNGIIIKNKNKEALKYGLLEFVQTLDKYDRVEIRNQCLAKYCSDTIINKLTNIYEGVTR